MSWRISLSRRILKGREEQRTRLEKRLQGIAKIHDVIKDKMYRKLWRTIITHVII